MKNIMTGLKKTGVAGLASLMLGTGCVSVTPGVKYNFNTNSEYFPTYEQAMKVLNEDNIRRIMEMQGYLMKEGTNLNVMVIAGQRAGTIQTQVHREKTEQGNITTINSSGVYRYNPELVRQVLKDADANRDKIITKKEILSLNKSDLGID